MTEWPIDRDLDERLRRLVADEIAAADPRQITFRERPARKRSLRPTALAVAAIFLLVAVLVWRSEALLPTSGPAQSTSGTPSAAPSGSPEMTPTAASATLTSRATPSGAPVKTLVPGVTPGPTADPALAPVRSPACLGYLAVPLQDGRVLFAPGCTELAPTLVYDSRTRMFTASGPMTTAAAFTRTTATRMQDGRVLFAGGVLATGPRSSMEDEIFDPSTGRFTPIGPFSPIANAASVLLPDGRVLIVGSNWDTPSAPDTAELFDPVGNTIAATGPMLSGGNPVGSSFSAVLLGNGKILVADAPAARSTRTQIYDPTTNTFNATAQSAVSRDATVFATALPDGRAMLFGGGTSIVEAYDPATDSFGRLASMPNAAEVVTYANLTDGRILVIGEDQRTSSLRWASGAWFDLRPVTSLPGSDANATVPHNLAVEIYDPAADKWTSYGDLSGARMAASCSVAPLPGGGAMVLDADRPGVVELFDPKTGKFTVNK